MIIFDNVFDEITQVSLSKSLKYDTPFYYKPHAVSGSKNPLFVNDGFFCHMVMDGFNGKKSNLFPSLNKLFKPLYQEVQKESGTNILLDRIKINFLKPKFDLRMYPYHIDNQSPHMVMIYYPNNSEGCTIIGKRFVRPKKGRVVIFDGKVKHTNYNSLLRERMTINFNFLKV